MVWVISGGTGVSVEADVLWRLVDSCGKTDVWDVSVSGDAFVENKLPREVVYGSDCPVVGEVSGGTAFSVETELLGKVVDS